MPISRPPGITASISSLMKAQSASCGRQWAKHKKPALPRVSQPQVRHTTLGFPSARRPQRAATPPATTPAKPPPAHRPADALDDDIDTLAGRYPANALGEAFCG